MKDRYPVFCLLLLFAPFAYCHKVNIYAYVEDGVIHSESYFSCGAKCKNAVVEVFDEKEKTKLLEGKTDEGGRFSFKIPKSTSLKLVLNAGMGHRAEFTLSEDELKGAMVVKQHPKPPSVRKPSITEIIGGIGYIVGILGIIAYFRAKRGKKID